MAHIKVIRRSMRPEEWNQLRFGWLKRHIYAGQYEITPILVRDARQISEETYAFDPEGEYPLKRGELYFTPDGTAFFRADVTIPAEFRSGPLYLKWKTAAEIIVKVNDRYAGGLDPNRERVRIDTYIQGESFRLDAVGYNRSKPDDERDPSVMAVRGCRQVFDGAYLVKVDEDVQSLVYDLTVLLDIVQSDAFPEDYRGFLTSRIDKALDCIDFDDFTSEGVKACAAYLETHVFADQSRHSGGKVCLTGHSHLDIAYYWRGIHAVQKNLRTVLIQLRLMDQYREFRYTHTQPYLYETLEKYYPEVFDELREKVRTGQFEPVGAMYVEPDCNIPSAESLIRQCLYGQTTYKRMFGRYVNNAWLPDVFGNSWILPQILKKSGVDYFVSNKMSTWNDTNRFPHNSFIWRGADGSEVLASVPPTHFISWMDPAQIRENIDAYQDADTGAATLVMFGYGDGGSGCTEEMLELHRRIKRLSIMPETELIGGQDYLDRELGQHRDQLAVWDGELYLEMHRGTFTTKADLKRYNRRLEFKFRDAELLNVLRRGDKQPQITALYKRFLVNQFHDILPGSHIHPVYEDAMRTYREIDSALDAIIGKGQAYFNSLNFDRNVPFFVPDAEGSDKRFGVRGKWAFNRIGALSSIEPDAIAPSVACIRVQDRIAETAAFRIEFGPDGSIEHFYDKRLEQDFVSGAFHKLRLFADTPGNYDAWDILPGYRDREYPVTVEEPLRLDCCCGGVAVLSCVLRVGSSAWTRKIRVFADRPYIEVENDVDWQESHKLAKVEFECAVLARQALTDNSAGYTPRATHRNASWEQARFEVCCHKWADLSETGAGVAIINRDKYGVGFFENRISLSLLRATERPDVTSDRGRHRFSYLIYPHAGDAVAADVNRIALQYNVDPVPAEISCELPDVRPLYLQAVKTSEDGRMTVMRLSEQDGKRGKIRLKAPVRLLDLLERELGETDTLDYGPFEILTIGLMPENA